MWRSQDLCFYSCHPHCTPPRLHNRHPNHSPTPLQTLVLDCPDEVYLMQLPLSCFPGPSSSVNSKSLLAWGNQAYILVHARPWDHQVFVIFQSFGFRSGGQRRADNVSSLALPLPPCTIIYDSMADVLGLVDHHIQHWRHDEQRSPIPQSQLQSHPVPPPPTNSSLPGHRQLMVYQLALNPELSIHYIR